MKWIAVAIIAALVGASWWLMQDRNGRVYKKLAKLVRPVLTQPVAAQELELPFKADFANMLEGQDAWDRKNFDGVRTTIENGELLMSSAKETVWWMNWQGPAMFHSVSGNFEATMRVYAKSQRDPDKDVNSAFQFGGLMLRDPLGDKFLTGESYVFNVVGHRGDSGLQVETKSTKDGWSQVSGFDWDAAAADLRVVRQGSNFVMYAKAIEATDWAELITYERPDLPSQLQIGVIAYAYSAWTGHHDLSARFSSFEVRDL